MAEHQTTPEHTPDAPTREIAAWVADPARRTVDANALRWARHCLLDWVAVTIPGAHEDLVRILIDEARSDEAEGRFPVLGQNDAFTPSWSVLINGAASHALDYDDVNQALHGHPTVAVMPAVLVAGAALGKSLDEVLTSFVVGYEVACLVGEMTGDGHYDAGWHATGTVGTFGAAAGTAHLMALGTDAVAHALGTAATMAAGLKSMFGTMSKPLHAGRAAQSGYLAARTAARGWTARTDALECAQGFWATQAPDAVAFSLDARGNAPLQIHTNLFKYHAACYLTHSAIEACARIRETHAPDPERIETVRLRVAEGHLKVCNIPDPVTGLEIKFSLRHTAAMALAGVDTAAIGNYSDEIARRADLTALRQKVVVEPQASARTMTTEAEVIVETRDAVFTNRFDVGIPAADTEAQEARLSAKFLALTGPCLGDERAEALRETILTGSLSAMDVLSSGKQPL